MSFFELFLIYAVSWWLVLFMVLPWGVKIAASPEKGHAASAPINPNLKKKLLATSLIALLVPLAAYGINEARAESSIYTTKGSGGSDCIPADAPHDDSVNAVDNDATIGGSSNADMGDVPTYLDAPISDYTDAQRSDKIGQGIINVGVAETNTRTGEVRINGTKVGGSTLPSHCK